MLIKLDKDFMVNTDCIRGLAIESPSVWLYYGEDLKHQWYYGTYYAVEEERKKALQSKFDELSEILEKAVNIKLNNGSLLCAHCGAPNSE